VIVVVDSCRELPKCTVAQRAVGHDQAIAPDGGHRQSMDTFLPLTVVGVVAGCIYALTAAGLVVTYTTSGIFNFAHGAIGMVSAFAFWDLSQHHHWPSGLAFAAVVLVVAPALGLLIERLLMRRIESSSLDTSLTVTVGLLVLLIGIAKMVWDPSQPRFVPQFFPTHSVSVAGVVISWHQLTVVAAAIAVAIALRLFLYSTRPGIATRAVVDDRELAALTGAAPVRFSQLGWALGAMLAALAGVLLAPLVTLDINTLTLIVINGYAAAMVGRLKNLPLTFVGGVALGLLESYAVGYLPVGNLLGQIKPIIPMVFLFVALLVLPQARLRGRSTVIRPPRVAGLRESLVTAAAFLAVAAVLAVTLSAGTIATVSLAVCFGLVMLSLVLLTGYGGQVSLCQLTFAGIGAFAMAKVGDGGSVLGLLAAVGLAGAVGALIALPALRLRGLYLALSTLAFAYSMDYVFFQNPKVFGNSLSLSIKRLHVGGLSLTNGRAYFFFLCAVFALVAVGVLAVRRSTLGRRLVAMGDSPAAAATVGMSLTRLKLLVFTLSAALAGLGGALLGGVQGLVGPADFPLLSSILLLLLAVVFGIRTTTGMLFAGLVLAYGPVIQTHVHGSLRDIVSLGVGLGAVGIGRNPNGTFGGNTPLQRLRDRRAPDLPAVVAVPAPMGPVEGAGRAVR
jgi:branched-chain amino acid transport system permease protein